MGVVLLDDRTILGFLQDGVAFDLCVKERFQELDSDGDGLLSRDELRRGFVKSVAFDEDDQAEDQTIKGLHGVVFDRFDVDKDGAMSPEEFRTFVAEMMLAFARGIGSLPLPVALEEDSLFMKAVEHHGLQQQRNKESPPVEAAAATATTCRSPGSASKTKARKRHNLPGLFVCLCGAQSSSRRRRSEQVRNHPEANV